MSVDDRDQNPTDEWASVAALRERPDAAVIEAQDAFSGRWRHISDGYWDDCVIDVRYRKAVGDQAAVQAGGSSVTDPTLTEQAAIDAIKKRLGRSIRHVGAYWLLEILRAIPLDYCVQRAIGEGALIEVEMTTAQGPEGDVLVTEFTDSDLYRLATENETRPPARDFEIEDLRWLVGHLLPTEGVIALPPRLGPLVREIAANHNYSRFTVTNTDAAELWGPTGER